MFNKKILNYGDDFIWDYKEGSWDQSGMIIRRWLKCVVCDIHERPKCSLADQIWHLQACTMMCDLLNVWPIKCDLHEKPECPLANHGLPTAQDRSPKSKCAVGYKFRKFRRFETFDTLRI